MAQWPHEEAPLTEDEGQAYRHLLYMAMLDIRILCQSRGPASLNPWQWWRQYHESRLAGALADWLHNLAHYAAMDFRGFNAERFWGDYEYNCRHFREFGPGGRLDYRGRYERQLSRSQGEGGA